MSFSIENKLDRIEKSLAQKADKADIETLYAELDKKADKTDIERLDKRIDAIEQRLDRVEHRLDQVIDLLDGLAKKFDIMITEQRAISATLNFHEQRIGNLEERVFGHRVREQDEKYGKKHD